MPFYAVKKGRSPGVYPTWAACSVQVTGYAGAVFQKWSTEEATDRRLRDDVTLIVPAAVLPGTIRLITDGACQGNPGRGGCCAIVQFDDGTEQMIVQAFHHTTNNRMELMAAIVGLVATPHGSHVYLVTDSRYLIGGLNTPITQRANRDLWQQLHVHCGTHTIVPTWVEGHAGNVDNHRADRAAVHARSVGPWDTDTGYCSS